MRTVGQLLKETREAKLITLDEVEKATKIRQELLEALEEDDYSKLPPATFVQGFIKNYAKFLKVDSEKFLAIFRREFQESADSLVMEAFSAPQKGRRLKITPSQLITSSVVLVVMAFFTYLWIQYHGLVGAPRLVVNTPQDQSVIDNPLVTVAGMVDPEATLTINNQPIGLSDKGEFKAEIKLTGATGKITIVATSKFGQKTVVDKTVYLKR